MSDQEVKRGRGRPKGSRNKSKLISAQLAFDNSAELAAETLIAIMKNDTDELNLSTKGDVPMTLRLQACKIVLDKAIANERDKLDSGKEPEEVPEKVTPSGPRVIPRAATA